MGNVAAPTKTCCVCGEYAGFHWVHDGVERFYCRHHYNEAELANHQAEKDRRLVAMAFGVISGNTPEFIDCPIGEHCPWCLQVGLRQETVNDLTTERPDTNPEALRVAPPTPNDRKGNK